MKAEERGIEMLKIPRCELPLLAQKFYKKLSAEHGNCLEVCLTAYIVYAQIVEKLECTDELYIAKSESIAWFKKRIGK